MLPGLCGDAASSSFRLFLGTLPALGVEQKLLRQVQPVFPWFTSRKRVKEQMHELLDLDLASVDFELIMRYCHVFYVRRQMFDESIEKQLTILDTGKPPKLGDVTLVQCLTDANLAAVKRLHHEMEYLGNVKQRCVTPTRPELNPSARFETLDTLCMMRVAENDAVGMEDLESRCKPYLPSGKVHAAAQLLAKELFGLENLKNNGDLDKKDAKLWSRMVPSDYNKTGCVEKYRPIDVTAYFRFYGERVSKPVQGTEASESFRRALWGNIFRKFATHASYLVHVSENWAKFSGLVTSTPDVQLPFELAKGACLQQSLFPAHRFRAMYAYSSPDLARQSWRVDPLIPMMRLLPLIGQPMCEEALAHVLVEDFWQTLNLGETESPADDRVVRALRSFVGDAVSLHGSNLDAVLHRFTEGFQRVVPPLSAEELATAEGESSAATESGAEGEATAPVEAKA